ncbi:MAG TPA: HD domain-containing phosphohydrolase [Rhizomicrobium sp.]
MAVNPTVQIYLSEAAVPNFNIQSTPASQAQTVFLASYVASLSQRGAFASDAGRNPGAGLVVLDAQQRTVVATAGYRPSSILVGRLMAAMKNGEAGPLASWSGTAFLIAIQPMQGMPGAKPIGYVVGERNVDAAFWETDGAVVRADGGYESLIAVDPKDGPVLVGTSLTKADAKAVLSSGEGQAAREPLHLENAPGLLGRNALHLGVPVAGTDWILVESIPAKPALAGVEQRIRTLIVILLLSLLAIIAAILALWRHNAGLRAVETREQSARLYRGVIELLLQSIDQRDPGAAAHSRRVASLSRAMALDMGASLHEAETTEMAGALLNVGKIFVPSELLTKAGPLDDADRRKLDEGTARWLALLGSVPFEPPLEPILSAAQDLMHATRLDADAPRDAYVIMVANAAVALMSTRSYRPARSLEDTLKLLSEGVNTIPPAILHSLRQVIGRANAPH